MRPTPLDILTLMISNQNRLPGGPVTGPPSPTGEASGLFSDIMGGYLSTGMQPGLPSGMEESESFLTAELMLGSDVGTRSTDDITNATTAPNSAEYNRQLLSILPRQMGVIGGNVKDILRHKPVEVEAGKYEILSARVTDGKLSLEVIRKDHPNQAIRLILPAEILNDAGGLSSKRVVLPMEAYESSRVNSLLSQLSLKEIEINTANVDQAVRSTAEPLRITLTAENTAGEFLIRTKLARARVKAVSDEVPLRQNIQSESEAARSGSVKIVTGEQAVLSEPNDLRSQLLSGNARGQTQIGTRTLFAQPDFFQKGNDEAGEGSSGDKGSILDSLFGGETALTSDKTAGEKGNIQQLRFTLPENLNTVLKSNSKAVTIRIEPEHLGPARLSLSMVDDRLKARIVVSSVSARAALEGSLDRLVDQLARADIKVDQVEIAINGDSTHNEFLGRQPHWRRRMAARIPATEALSFDPTTGPAAPAAWSPAQYVGSEGVNVLA
jgi:hypothetical protein